MSDFSLNKIKKSSALVTKLIIITIIIIFILEIILTFRTNDFGRTLIFLGAKWNPAIGEGEYWRLISCALLHGNLIHLLLNIVGLYAFGSEVELIFGRKKYFIILLFSTYSASLSSYFFSNNVSIGASGALFGIVGSLIIFYYLHRKVFSFAELRFKSMYTIIIINIIVGLLIPIIDNFAHIGGLIAGGITSFIITPKYNIVISENNEVFIDKKNKQTFEIVGLLIVLSSLVLITIFFV